MENPAETATAVQRLRSLHQTRSDDSGNEPSSDPSNDQHEPRKVETNSSFISRYDKGWRRIVTNFSPSWFSVTMGTGIVSTIFYSIPWKAQWLYYLSIIFFVLNVALFSSAFCISVLRYTMWPEIWTVMIEDSNNSLFLGTIPMGFATIVEMWIFVCARIMSLL